MVNHTAYLCHIVAMRLRLLQHHAHPVHVLAELVVSHLQLAVL
jgi:hypothetical protein